LFTFRIANFKVSDWLVDAALLLRGCLFCPFMHMMTLWKMGRFKTIPENARRNKTVSPTDTLSRPQNSTSVKSVILYQWISSDIEANLFSCRFSRPAFRWYANSITLPLPRMVSAWVFYCLGFALLTLFNDYGFDL